jgi:hypothetical protein
LIGQRLDRPIGTSSRAGDARIACVYPGAGEVLHFSEDPTIARFEPHRAATAQQPEPYVWAVDAARAPDYWFPRQCPRVLAWVAPRRPIATGATFWGRPAGACI